MPLMPVDIQNKEFSKALRGYKKEEVDKYLESVSRDYEEIFAQNIELRQKIQGMEAELKQYRLLETTLQQTLVLAQQTADEVKKAAHRESELMMKEAEQRKNELLLKAKQDIEHVSEEVEEIKKRRELIRVQLKSFLHAQLDLSETFDKERLI